MTMPRQALPPEMRCPSHGAPLDHGAPVASGEKGLKGECGCEFPVRNGVPRFVPASNYADGFGIQWNAFRKTQLDSHSGAPISRNRLTRCLGGSLEPLRGASVLEVGCGAGRFTEVLLDAGARVFACDLSGAVEANLENCGASPRHFVCQADVMKLPVGVGSFDFVIALGMIQHTPSPEETITALAKAVRPGGVLVLDHYRTPRSVLRLLHAITPRGVLRPILLRLPRSMAFRATGRIASLLLPLHRMLWRRGFVVDRIRAVWRRVSPVFDYYDSFPELGEKGLAEWARLDTHDGLTDFYKHLRTPEQIAAALTAAGLLVDECRPGGNGVEARASRPAPV